MTALSIALSNALHSGARAGIPRHVARAAAAIRRVVGAVPEGHIKSYVLSDLDGRPLGTVPAARARPTLGVQHPTVYLRRRC